MFPPSFVAKVKKLLAKVHIHIDLRNLINLKGLINININCNNPSRTEHQTLCLNPNDFASKDFSELMCSAVDQSKIPVVKTDTCKIIEHIRDAVALESETLSKLKPVLNSIDFGALEAAFVIKRLFKEKIPIDNYKASLIERYGDRGRKICDIVSAGYFESEIMPLYERLQDVDNGMQLFKSQFDRIVVHEAFAIFVRSSMSPYQLKKIIKQKMGYHRRIGVHYLNIHAIGKVNISKVQKVVKELVSDGEVAILELLESPEDKPVFVYAKLGTLD